MKRNFVLIVLMVIGLSGCGYFREAYQIGLANSSIPVAQEKYRISSVRILHRERIFGGEEMFAGLTNEISRLYPQWFSNDARRQIDITIRLEKSDLDEEFFSAKAILFLGTACICPFFINHEEEYSIEVRSHQQFNPCGFASLQKELSMRVSVILPLALLFPFPDPKQEFTRTGSLNDSEYDKGQQRDRFQRALGRAIIQAIVELERNERIVPLNASSASSVVRPSPED